MALGQSRALLARTNQADRISWDIVINADDDKNDAYRVRRLYIYLSYGNVRTHDLWRNRIANISKLNERAREGNIRCEWVDGVACGTGKCRKLYLTSAIIR